MNELICAALFCFSLDLRCPTFPALSLSPSWFFLSDLEILMAVFFTHISSGHKKWLNYVNWEVIRLGRHGRCTGIALHCVVITVHLSTWF